MAGPWEEYQTPQADHGPWEAYGGGDQSSSKTLHGLMENTGRSAEDFVKGLPQPFTEQGRANTGAIAQTLFHLARGALMGPFMKDEDYAVMKAIGNHFADRYGGIDKAMDTAYNDPVGFAADVASLAAPAKAALTRAAEVPEVVDAANAARTATTDAARTALPKLKQAGAAAAAGGDSLAQNFELTKPLSALTAVPKALKAAVEAWQEASPEARAGAARNDYLDAVAKELTKKRFDGLNRTQQAQVIEYADKLPEVARQEMESSQGVTRGTLPPAPESPTVRGPVRPPVSGQPVPAPAPAPAAAPPAPAPVNSPPPPNNLAQVAAEAQAATLEPPGATPPAPSAAEPVSPMARPAPRSIAQQLFDEAEKSGTIPAGTKPGEPIGGTEPQNPEAFQQRARSKRATDADTIAQMFHEVEIPSGKLGQVSMDQWRQVAAKAGIEFPKTATAVRKLVFEVGKSLRGMEGAVQ